MVHYYINSQKNPGDPTGTIITVSSGLAGITQPAGSGYYINKLGSQRLGEFLDVGMCPQKPLLPVTKFDS